MEEIMEFMCLKHEANLNNGSLNKIVEQKKSRVKIARDKAREQSHYCGNDSKLFHRHITYQDCKRDQSPDTQRPGRD